MIGKTTHRKRILAVLGVLSAVALATLLADPVWAAPRDRVLEELERTDAGLDRAREIVGECDSERARRLLVAAEHAQEAAWAQFHLETPTGLLRAGVLTREARVLARKAVNLAREDQSLRRRAHREIERTRVALQRVRDELGDDPPAAVVHLVREARSQLERAERQFGEQHYEAALRLAVSAQRLLRQASGASDGSGALQRLRREIERTDRLIDRAGEPIRESGVEGAIRMLERGIDLQDRAKDDLASGHPRAALAATRESRDLVNRAARLAGGPLDAERVLARIEALEARLADAADIVAESGSELAQGLLDRGRDHLTRARDLLAEENFRAAMAEARVAERLIRRAVQVSG
ncbi:MAG: hypothetical protein QGH59_08125 [Gemmatimonadota bacterium]|nr:hypothetical protein [Gemmatimonadota bacterium]